MADNFDFKKYLLENKLGSYSKATLNEEMQTETTPQYKTYADVVNAIAKKYSYTVYHDEIEEFMHDKDSLKAIVDGKDPIQAYEDFYSIKRESKEDPIDPHDPYGTGGMSTAGMFQEKEIEDTIYGTGDDDDYDRKSDAERTGAKFSPHKEPERSPSKFTKPSSHGEVLEKLVNKMKILNRLAIDKYKYAKKEARPAAKEELRKTVEYMLGSNSRYADEVVKGLLQPIHDQWAKYAQSKNVK